ncbi:intercellular trafficking and secretion [Metarhizium rileyi]|uniref:Sorting nexin-4 n=1 Tax=Metarhizium rileyi (strain RCEF 4871) TaxID=1649241 RepID=A0A5C6GHN6_METRR|nr:intercellular trafficking and secretion [Metarhizium rileyi]
MAVTDHDHDQDNFSSISWTEHAGGDPALNPVAGQQGRHTGEASGAGQSGHELGTHGRGGEKLQCTVGSPLKENDGSKDAFISYLITTHSTFQSFQKETTTVRRRFTDFVFLYKQLMRDYPATAVPPLPDKQRMEYVRGDRFGSDFTSRRAHSFQRFLARLSLHSILRRAPILHNFLESPDWNATMRSRSARASLSTDPSNSSGVFDNFADTFINAFTKLHKPDRRFLEVKEKSDKLDEDLANIEKIVARVVRRESDLETDLKDLAEQFQKLITLEPGVETAAHAFAASIEDTAAHLHTLRDVTDQDYLGSLRDMQAYSLSLKNLLRAREQKQLDFEQLTEYLNKSTTERDSLQSGYASSGAGSFIRAKIEDVRGVDHEQARRERQRKLELRVEELTTEVEGARATSDMFDDEVVREVADFERIKRAELKTQLGGLADAHVNFYGEVINVWERYIQEMDKEGLAAA